MAKKTKAADLLQIKTATMSNIGARSSQQDAFGISDINNEKLVQEKGVLAIVSDGMGGLENGAQSSLTTVAVFQEYFRTALFTAQPHQELLRMTAQANKNVLRRTRERGDRSGATLIATYVTGQSLYFVSVGDSRIALLRGETLIPLNRRHVYARELDKEEAFGERSTQEALSHPERKSLTSYIGQDPVKHIDFNTDPVQLFAGDRVLLMTDGIFNTLTDAEILEELGGRREINRCMAGLQKRVLEKQKAGQDNFTAVCLQV